jgi:hypothetical protein
MTRGKKRELRYVEMGEKGVKERERIYDKRNGNIHREKLKKKGKKRGSYKKEGNGEKKV